MERLSAQLQHGRRTCPPCQHRSSRPPACLKLRFTSHYLASPNEFISLSTSDSPDELSSARKWPRLCSKRSQASLTRSTLATRSRYSFSHLLFDICGSLFPSSIATYDFDGPSFASSFTHFSSNPSKADCSFAPSTSAFSLPLESKLSSPCPLSPLWRRINSTTFDYFFFRSANSVDCWV